MSHLYSLACLLSLFFSYSISINCCALASHLLTLTVMWDGNQCKENKINTTAVQCGIHFQYRHRFVYSNNGSTMFVFSFFAFFSVGFPHSLCFSFTIFFTIIAHMVYETGRQHLWMGRIFFNVSDSLSNDDLINDRVFFFFPLFCFAHLKCA